VLETADLLIRDSDLTVRRATVPVIAAAGEQEPVSALERLGRLLIDLDAGVQETTRESFLELCGTQNPRLLPVLGRLAADPASTVYLPALEGLTQFVATRPDAVLQAVTPVVQEGAKEAQEPLLADHAPAGGCPYRHLSQRRYSLYGPQRPLGQQGSRKSPLFRRIYHLHPPADGGEIDWWSQVEEVKRAIEY
jgi:hypothetical protein